MLPLVRLVKSVLNTGRYNEENTLPRNYYMKNKTKNLKIEGSRKRLNCLGDVYKSRRRNDGSFACKLPKNLGHKLLAEPHWTRSIYVPIHKKKRKTRLMS